MKYNIVAGEELKKLLIDVLDNPIPFNEDMSKGCYSSEPFSENFIIERSAAHSVSSEVYKEKLSIFLKVLKEIKHSDEIHLYFGEDGTCIANREFLINYFAKKVKQITLHIVDEYTGKELKIIDVSN